jgi:hypothetical protein
MLGQQLLSPNIWVAQLSGTIWLTSWQGTGVWSTIYADGTKGNSHPTTCNSAASQ